MYLSMNNLQKTHTLVNQKFRCVFSPKWILGLRSLMETSELVFTTPIDNNTEILIVYSLLSIHFNCLKIELIKDLISLQLFV